MAAYYTFEDLSGSAPAASTSDNPYDGLIQACNNDASEIQGRYHTHRTNRNSQQKAKILASEFAGVSEDAILKKLADPSIEPGYVDWRNCLVFWARPPEEVRYLIGIIQQKLVDVAPKLWTMPSDCLHMTALEVTHSQTADEIEALVAKLLPSAAEIADATFHHRARLVKPLVSFDSQALALSFLPASGETGRSAGEDAYTYHHLRRDLHSQVESAGVKVASRYVIPSAHLTIARFIDKREFEGQNGKVDGSKCTALIKVIDNLNAWLEAEYWPKEGPIKKGGEWIVGEGKGLDCRKGTLWYGGGETVHLGKGF